MDKKVLILGAQGMAGHIIATYLEERSYRVTGLSRGQNSTQNSVQMDVGDTGKLEQLIADSNFDVVVNGIGILNKDAEDHADKAIWFNSYFPHLLEQWGKKYKFKLIHISTDCVFSGKSSGAYTEQSFKDGIGFYAQSKALGEVINDKDLTFRTSIIGPELKKNGIGLFHWFMSQKGNDPVKGFSAAYWTGVTTIVLAMAIKEAIEQDLTGLYHLVNNEKISKYELVSIFNTTFREGRLSIIPDDAYKIDKSLVNNRGDFNFSVPGYAEMIAGMKQWMEQHKYFYNDYE